MKKIILVLGILCFYACGNSHDNEHEDIVEEDMNNTTESIGYGSFQDFYKVTSNLNLKIILGHLLSETLSDYSAMDSIEMELDNMIARKGWENTDKDSPFILTKQDSLQLVRLGIKVTVKNDNWWDFLHNDSTFFTLQTHRSSNVFRKDTLLIGLFFKYNHAQAALANW
jgi:hypothetical protein